MVVRKIETSGYLVVDLGDFRCLPIYRLNDEEKSTHTEVEFRSPGDYLNFIEDLQQAVRDESGDRVIENLLEKAKIRWKIGE